jgi:hypothetical protein
VTPVEKATVLEKGIPGAAKVVALDLPRIGLTKFGSWLVDTLNTSSGSHGTTFPIGAELKSVHYSDRYLRSPLTVRLLRGVLSALKSCGLSESTVVNVRTMTGDGYPGSLFWSDWTTAGTQRSVTQADIQSVGCVAEVEVVQYRGDIPHQRVMTLEWVNGQRRRVSFDQGFGFVQAARQAFDFAAPPDAQTARLKAIDLLVFCDEPSSACVEIL